MKKYFSKVLLSFILIATIFVLFGSNTTHAQSVTLGPVTASTRTIVQNPFGAPGNAAQIAESSCPDSNSVVVGFNLFNVGNNFSKDSGLYCKKFPIPLSSSSSSYVKYVIENPWGGSGVTAGQIANSSCPDGSVLVGINMYNLGDNYSPAAALYCKTVSSAVSLSPYSIVQKLVAQNPWGGIGDSSQIAASSCPDGSVLVGFNLLNMGSNYSPAGDLYCKKVSFFDHTISASNISSITPGGTAVSTVVATLAPGGTTSITFSGTCIKYAVKEDIDDGQSYTTGYNVICNSSNPSASRYSVFTAIGSTSPTPSSVASTFATSSVCGANNFTVTYVSPNSSNFACSTPTTITLPGFSKSVTLTLTKIVNSSNVNILGKTDGTGMNLVSFNPTSIKPEDNKTASSLLTISAGANVSVGTYTATVESKQSDDVTATPKTANFTIVVPSTATLPNLTASVPVTSSSITVGVSQIFSSTIRNIGTAGTVSSFSNFFQTADRMVDPATRAPLGGAIITDRPYTTMSALAAGASSPASSNSIIFTSAGQYSIRACADKTNNSSAGVINESVEGDNCSEWVNITVNPSAAMTGDITASNCTIPENANSCISSLSWTTSNPQGTSSVTTSSPYANTILYNLNSGSGQATVPYNSRIFYLYNNSIQLDSATATATCVTGTSWVPSQNKCATTTSGTCSDGIKNGDETGVDSGGRCGGTTSGTCSDGIKNGDETGVDSGGRCGVDGNNPRLDVTTQPVTVISYPISTGGGTVMSVGNETIIERGLVWSESPSPRLPASSTVGQNRQGNVSGFLSGPVGNTAFPLVVGKTYYVAAYGIGSSNNIWYGGDVTMTKKQPKFTED